MIYPVIGILGLGYSAYKLALLFNWENIFADIATALVIFYVILKLTLKLFKWLEKRWQVERRWHVIRIFIVFAVTGSMSLIVTRPLFDWLGFTKANFEVSTWLLILYYPLKFFAIMPFYTLMLVFFGWLFREYDFFLKFALKMVGRFGLKKLSRHIESKS